MKKLLLFMTLILMISCNNKKSGENKSTATDKKSESNNSGSIVFKVDGTSVETEPLIVQRFIWDKSTPAPLINLVSNMHKDKRAININISGAIPGTYSFTEDKEISVKTGGVYWPDYSQVLKSYLFESGQIVLTEVNTDAGYISGTFSGIVKNADGESFSITEGKFNKLKLTPGISNWEEEADKLMKKE